MCIRDRANDGVYCAPTPIASITKAGKALPIKAPGSACEQRVDPDVARGTTSLLTNVFKAPGSGARYALAGRQAAGKSGTTDRSNETWFVGYTPQMSTAVWVGTPNDPGNTQALENIRLGGQYYSGIVGSSIAGSIWKATFDRALTGAPAVPFTEPSQGITQGVKVAIPSVSRRTVDDAKQLLTQAGFLPRVVQIYSNARVGAVIGTSPSGNATRGSAIKILVSKGPDPNPPAPTTAPVDPNAPPAAPPAAPPG